MLDNTEIFLGHKSDILSTVIVENNLSIYYNSDMVYILIVIVLVIANFAFPLFHFNNVKHYFDNYWKNPNCCIDRKLIMNFGITFAKRIFLYHAIPAIVLIELLLRKNIEEYQFIMILLPIAIIVNVIIMLFWLFYNWHLAYKNKQNWTHNIDEKFFKRIRILYFTLLIIGIIIGFICYD